MPSAVKSIPTPGVTFIPETIWAICPLPLAWSSAMTCSLVRPAGSILPTTPSKMTLVALPMIFDAALVQDDDPVGVHDRADPLGDDEYGRLAGVGAQCRAQPRIGAGVERREAVVEEVDRRSLHKGARDRQALALAAGNVRPALVDWRVQPAGHLLDEVLRLGHLEGVPELLLGRILLAE